MKSFIFILSSLIFFSPLFADTIIMKNGDKIEGIVIISIKDGSLIIKKDDMSGKIPLELIKEFKIDDKKRFEAFNPNPEINRDPDHKIMAVAFVTLGVIEFLDYDDINDNPYVKQRYKNRTLILAIVSSLAGIYYLFK